MAAAEWGRHVVEVLDHVELNAGDSSRASHVWRVSTPQGPEIWRRAWWSAPEVSAFMLGLSRLFATDPRDLEATAGAHQFWQALGVWVVPEVLGHTQFQGAGALRVTCIEGDAGELIDADAFQLGQQVAAVHVHAGHTFGDIRGKSTRPLHGFYPRALSVLREVVPRFSADNWRAHWAEVEATFQTAPSPQTAVPMLLDWAGSQFVWRAGQPYALVDVESSALAPAELDLCLWEVLLSPDRAVAFRTGYERTRPFPNLTPHRAACRLILLALEVEGSPPLPQWLALPAHFDQPTSPR